MSASECVKVMVRVRPMSQKEKNEKCESCVELDSQGQQITIIKPGEKENQKTFGFDYCFSGSSKQESIYEETAFSLVESVVEGYNGTIFAYGQTGCGKTFTMMGDPASEEFKGIIPRSFSHIMNIIQVSKDKDFLVRCSYIEIYNEEIHDLLGKDVKQRYKLKETTDKGVFIDGLSITVVKSVAEMEKLMVIGNKNRSTGETLMNKDSSRSHSIFTVYVEASGSNNLTGGERITAGKLNLVDLAGSERQSKTQATGERLKEATKINYSLTALGMVISALVDGKSSHIPYRDSKLTRILQDSLGGNTKTVMIAAVSPADYNYDESLGTLRYAARAKNVQNKPKVNEDPKDALIKEYAEEIKRLKQLLEMNGKGLTLDSAGLLNLGKLSKQPENSNKQGEDRDSDDEEQIIKSNTSKKEVATLEEQNKLLNMDKERIDKELRQREEELTNEKEQRVKLEQALKEMEQKTLHGGQADDEQKRKFDNLRSKLKKQTKMQEQLLEEKRKKEEEMMNVEKNYQSLQEEVEDMKKILEKMSKRYKSATSEIKDLQREHEKDREELMESLRTQDKEIKLYKAIFNMLLNTEELDKIKSHATWMDDKNDYQITPFIFKDKRAKFPKLGKNQAMELVEGEKNAREIEFQSYSKKTHAGSDLENDIHSSKVSEKMKEEQLQNLIKRGTMGSYDKSQSSLRGMNPNQRLFGADEDEIVKEKKKHQNVMLDPLEYPTNDKKSQFNNNASNNNPRAAASKTLVPIKTSTRSMEVTFKATLHFDGQNPNKI